QVEDLQLAVVPDPFGDRERVVPGPRPNLQQPLAHGRDERLMQTSAGDERVRRLDPEPLAVRTRARMGAPPERHSHQRQGASGRYDSAGLHLDQVIPATAELLAPPRVAASSIREHPGGKASHGKRSSWTEVLGDARRGPRGDHSAVCCRSCCKGRSGRALAVVNLPVASGSPFSYAEPGIAIGPGGLALIEAATANTGAPPTFWLSRNDGGSWTTGRDFDTSGASTGDADSAIGADGYLYAL